MTQPKRPAGMTVTAHREARPHPAGTLPRAEQSLSLPGRVARLLEPLFRRRVAKRTRADLQWLQRLCESAPTTETSHQQTER